MRAPRDAVAAGRLARRCPWFYTKPGSRTINDLREGSMVRRSLSTACVRSPAGTPFSCRLAFPRTCVLDPRRVPAPDPAPVPGRRRRVPVSRPLHFYEHGMYNYA